MVHILPLTLNQSVYFDINVIVNEERFEVYIDIIGKHDDSIIEWLQRYECIDINKLNNSTSLYSDLISHNLSGMHDIMF